MGSYINSKPTYIAIFIEIRLKYGNIFVLNTNSPNIVDAGVLVRRYGTILPRKDRLHRPSYDVSEFSLPVLTLTISTYYAKILRIILVYLE